METAVFTCWLLFLLFSPAVPSCLPHEHTLYVERPECDFCVAIRTNICMGFCQSWERNLIRDYNSQRYRSPSCTYDKVEYRTVRLPGCPFDTDPTYTYPVAISCRCDNCTTSSTECTERAGRARCTKPVRPLYPAQGSYMIYF